ncbi:hypothetical protein ACOMHN_066856 [Nucella lapillus]
MHDANHGSGQVGKACQGERYTASPSVTYPRHQLLAIPPAPYTLDLIARLRELGDLTNRLYSLTSSTLTAAALDPVMSSVLDDHAPATRRKVSARCVPWFSTVAEQASTAKRHKRQMEGQYEKTSSNCLQTIIYSC